MAMYAQFELALTLCAAPVASPIAIPPSPAKPSETPLAPTDVAVEVAGSSRANVSRLSPGQESFWR